MSRSVIIVADPSEAQRVLRHHHRTKADRYFKLSLTYPIHLRGGERAGVLVFGDRKKNTSVSLTVRDTVVCVESPRG